MKWRDFKDEPGQSGKYCVRYRSGIYDTMIYIHGGWDDDDLYIESFHWLDESDDAFEEVARERGWVKEKNTHIVNEINEFIIQ